MRRFGFGLGFLRGRGLGGETYVDPVPDYLFKYLMDGNDSALTPINSPSIVAGMELPDKLASSFNGVDQYYTSTGGDAIATLGTGPFTLSFWINRIDPVSNQSTVSTGVGTDADDFRFRLTNAAKLQFRSGGTAITTPTTIVANTDYFVTVDSTGAGGTLNIYLNNVLDITDTSPPYNFNNSGKILRVGSVNEGSQLLDGELDGVRFYDRVLTAGERTALYDNRKWTPSEITTAAWYDAADADSIVESAGAVSQWGDKSGNSNHYLQASAPARPVYNLTDTIVWTETDSRMQITTVVENAVFNAFLVRKTNDVDFIDLTGGVNSFSYVSNDGSTNTAIHATFGAPTLHVNGTEETPSTRGDVDTLFATNSRQQVAFIGADTSTGWVTMDLGFYNGGFEYSGDYNEVIFITGSMTTDEIETVEGYLAHKWGIESELPSGHTYKTTPPTV